MYGVKPSVLPKRGIKREIGKPCLSRFAEQGDERIQIEVFAKGIVPYEKKSTALIIDEQAPATVVRRSNIIQSRCCAVAVRYPDDFCERDFERRDFDSLGRMTCETVVGCQRGYRKNN
jgi:hypothetical protein